MPDSKISGEELSVNEKRVLLALDRLGGSGSLQDIIKTEKFKEEIKEDIKIEGRIFLHCLRIYELLKIQKDGNKE